MFEAIKRFFGGRDKVVVREDVEVSPQFSLPEVVDYPASEGGGVVRLDRDFARVAGWLKAGYIRWVGFEASRRRGRRRRAYALTKVGALKVNAWWARHAS
jgi:hypothetical protein